MVCSEKKNGMVSRHRQVKVIQIASGINCILGFFKEIHLFPSFPSVIHRSFLLIIKFQTACYIYSIVISLFKHAADPKALSCIKFLIGNCSNGKVL